MWMRLHISLQSFGPQRWRPTKQANLTDFIDFLQSAPPSAFLSIHNSLFSCKVFILCRQDVHNPAFHRQRICDFVAKIILQTIQDQPVGDIVSEVQDSMTPLLLGLPDPVTSGDMLDACLMIGRAITRAATFGQYRPASERPIRTPTECLASFLDTLQLQFDAGNHNRSQLETIQKYQRCGESCRVRNETDLYSVTVLLRRAANDLSDPEMEGVRLQVQRLSEELSKHGSGGPPRTRLVDNIYGRVWESALNAVLLEDIPPQVLEASRAMREGFWNVVDGFTDNTHSIIRSKFVARLQDELPRPWSDKDPRLNFTKATTITRREFDDFLQVQATNGYEVAGDFFVAMSLFEVMKVGAPDHFPWMEATRMRYHNGIIPLKGMPKFHEVHSPPTLGGGITLCHHAPCTPGQQSVKPVMFKIWDLDAKRQDGETSDNMRALNRGLPYCTGISGYTHLFVSFFLQVQKSSTLNIIHAVLGLMIYLVYDGGHSWNECIRTLVFLQDQGLITIFRKDKVQVDGFPSYEDFIQLFVGTDTLGYLRNAVQKAHEAVIRYRRSYTSSY